MVEAESSSQVMPSELMRFPRSLQSYAVLCVWYYSHFIHWPRFFFSSYNFFSMFFFFRVCSVCSEFRYFEWGTDFRFSSCALCSAVNWLLLRVYCRRGESLGESEKKSHSLVSCWTVQTWSFKFLRKKKVFIFSSLSHLNFLFWVVSLWVEIERELREFSVNFKSSDWFESVNRAKTESYSKKSSKCVFQVW